jgi:hypothetical protein
LFGHAVTVGVVTAGVAGTNGVVAVAGTAGIAGFIVKKPQPLAQTVQSVPAFVRSFETAAARFTVASAWTCDGADGTKLTERLVGLIAIGAELILTLGSAVEVALIVTAVPTTGGAVKVVVAPLAVWYGLIAPQPPGTLLAHCTVQVTPPGATSFVTTALTVAWVPPANAVGGDCTNESDGGCTMIAVRAFAAFDGVVAGEDAVIVTSPPSGIVLGAVYIIWPPLAVCAGDKLKLPHPVTPPHVAVQFTPRLPVLGATVAASTAVDPVPNAAGGTVDIVTTIGAIAITVATADADTVGSVVDLAVIVTVPPDGIAVGPVKIAGVPLSVWAVIPPQFDALQLTDQSTPALAVSFATTAVSFAVWATPGVVWL